MWVQGKPWGRGLHLMFVLAVGEGRSSHIIHGGKCLSHTNRNSRRSSVSMRKTKGNVVIRRESICTGSRQEVACFHQR